MKAVEQGKITARRAAAARASAWITARSGGLRILQARALLELPWLVHAFSTRPGGTSRLNSQCVLNLGFTSWDTPANVSANRATLLAALGAERMKLVTLRQFHSDVIHALDAFAGPAAQRAPWGDAAIARTPGLLLAIQTADCVPVLLVDPRRRAVAAIHAGWRGTLRRIVAKTLGGMRMAFGTQPSDVVALLGPGIGGCCYEVGPEVAQAYASQFPRASEWFDGPFEQLTTGEELNPLKWLGMAPLGHDPPPPSVRMDLAAANRWQLLDTGVRARNIISSRLCTSCRTDLLFSHRREKGRTGRLMALIGVRT